MYGASSVEYGAIRERCEAKCGASNSGAYSNLVARCPSSGAVGGPTRLLGTN